MRLLPKEECDDLDAEIYRGLRKQGEYSTCMIAMGWRVSPMEIRMRNLREPDLPMLLRRSSLLVRVRVCKSRDRVITRLKDLTV